MMSRSSQTWPDDAVTTIDLDARVLASDYIRPIADQSPIAWYLDLADWYLGAESDLERARR
jgi:hypothetical protein